MLLLACGPINAQVLQGEWVVRADAAIDEHRKTGVTVIVLGADDRPIEGARVRIEQTRHDFVLGFAVVQPRPPGGDAAALPLWRCFNAVALDRLVRAGAGVAVVDDDHADAARQWDDWLDPIEISYGPVASADPSRTPDHAVGMVPADFADYLMDRFDTALAIGPAVNRFDLYADALSHSLVEDRLGVGFLNKLYDTADARRPDAAHTLRFRDGLEPRRSLDLRRRVRAFDIRQLRFDGVTIDQTFTGSINPAPLERVLRDRIATLGRPVTIAMLDAGGASQAAAALNLETALRLLFATPNIRGVYFAGVYGHEMEETAAGLIDDDGKLTACGQLLDTFFRDVWWSDVTETTDIVGNAKARVFTGRYRITATLADGRILETEAYLPKSDEARYVVLQAAPRQ